MNQKLPRLNAEQAIRVVEKLGFNLARQSDSHKIYKNQKGIRITILYHKGKILHSKIVKSIMKDAEITLPMLKGLL